MATALRARCPNCKTKVIVLDASFSGEMATVTCEGCGKKFGLRSPKNEGQASTGPDTLAAPTTAAGPTADDPFADLAGTLQGQLSPANVNWQDYRVRKPLIAVKPLAIAIMATFGIICVIAMGMFVSKRAAEIDMNAIGDSLLKGPADSLAKIHTDWQRYEDEQKQMTATIARQSDCEALLFPFMQLQEKQVSLLVRIVLLESQAELQLQKQDLPQFPPPVKPEGRSFRSNEAFMTNDFRRSEAKLTQNSEAVLSALHAAIEPLPSSANEVEKTAMKVLLVKRAACKALAEAHRGEDTSKTAVAIYELAEELKKARPGVPEGTKVVTTLPAAMQMVELATDRMIESLADRFTTDENSEIAKALKTLKQSF